MQTDLKRLSIDDVVLDWGLAETKTRLLNLGVSQDIVNRVLARNQTPADSEIIRNAIRLHRGEFLGHFIKNPLQWYEARFDLSEVRQVYLNRFFQGSSNPYRALTNLEQLARADERYQIPNYDLKKEIGRPVFVALTLSGPWQILEGTHRCCTRILRDDKAPDPNHVVPTRRI